MTQLASSGSLYRRNRVLWLTKPSWRLVSPSLHAEAHEAHVGIKTQSAKMDSTAVRAAVLQVFCDTAGSELVSETASLDSLGFDSIGVIDLRNSLANVTGVELDASIML